MNKKNIAVILCAILFVSIIPVATINAQNNGSSIIPANLLGSLKDTADNLKNQVNNLIKRLANADKGVRGEISAIATDNSNFTLQIGGKNADPITVNVGTATVYTFLNGDAAAVTDLKVGQNVGVKGDMADKTITATAVVINNVKPDKDKEDKGKGDKSQKGMKHAIGIITAVDSTTSSTITTLTIQQRGLTKGTLKVNVSSTTTITKHGTAATKADLVSGTGIVATGKMNASGELDATNIKIAGAFNLGITGTVTAVSSSSITVTVNNGKATGEFVVTPAAGAKLIANDGVITLADIEVGDIVKAKGVIDSSTGTNTLSATQIIVLGIAEEMDSED